MPHNIVSDNLRSYGSACSDLLAAVIHEKAVRMNNRAVVSHHATRQWEPYLAELDRRNAVNFPHQSSSFTELKHWLVPFHDETLEIVGGEPEVLGTVDASSALEAIAYYEA